MDMRPKAIVVGGGFSGLSAAAVLAKGGFEVHILEKNSQPGGRARVLKRDGFTFDMGPSWYWMPEVMEQFFNRFGKSTSDFFELRRLDPSYQVIGREGCSMAVPAGYQALREFFECIETGSASRLDEFLKQARLKYEKGMGEFVYKPGLSLREFADMRLLRSALKLDLFTSFSDHIRKYFRSEVLLQMLEFPVLFLGATPDKIPALYSMMNYADLKLGTWYPMGGMGKLVDAVVQTAIDAGASLHLNTNVCGVKIEGGRIVAVRTDKGELEADVVVSSADYHFTEQHLLPEKFRNYSAPYWDKRMMAPSCLLYYVGVDKKLPRLRHHNLFFEESFSRHAKAIYEKPEFPDRPLYYVCCPSQTDDTVAPAGMENLFILIPVAPGLKDTPEIRKKYFEDTIERLETYCGESIRRHVVSYSDYAVSDFINDYNAFKGNAYGLANTLWQTAVFKPVIKNRKLANMYYTGQLTVPGPGVPPSFISGQIVADYIINQYRKLKNIHETTV